MLIDPGAVADHAAAPQPGTAGAGTAPGAGGRSTWSSTSSRGPKACTRAVDHRQHLVDAGERARPMRDDDDDAAALAHAERSPAVSAFSPSASRLELGSSSTTRNGIAIERARERDALALPAESTAPRSPICVS